MPLPTPNKEESKNDFVGRCISELSDKKEFKDNKQRVAVCYAQYDKAMSKMDNPLETKASINDAGEMEVTIAKKYSEAEAGVYKSYMSMCASDDKMFTDTASMDDKQTYAACAVSYDKMRAMMMDDSKGELTEKQKKLPPALQKKIIEKMKKEGKYKEEDK